jgi:hypothetical protein
VGHAESLAEFGKRASADLWPDRTRFRAVSKSPAARAVRALR